MKTNLQDRADIGSMVGPAVTLTAGMVDVVPLGSVQGGVWPNGPDSYGWTCQACASWRPSYPSDVLAYAALRDHERRDCTARRDGGEQW